MTFQDKSPGIADIEECMQLGTQDFVIKPVTYSESLKTVQYFKTLYEELNEKRLHYTFIITTKASCY